MKKRGKSLRTLRDVWHYERRLTTDQAAERTGLSRSTLYSLNRKEDAYFSTVLSACQGLGLSLDEFTALDPCPDAEKYRAETEGKGNDE